jgi:hypothetical protein
MSERRRNRRLAARRRAELGVNGRPVVAITENIGRGGVAVRLPGGPRLCVGDRFDIAFPDLGPDIAARAEVCWVSVRNPARVGLRFLTGFRKRTASVPG